jgi:hypothetical protein
VGDTHHSLIETAHALTIWDESFDIYLYILAVLPRAESREFLAIMAEEYQGCYTSVRSAS